jgi:D-arabinose 1-dehydrogenase-like Zn-dependent alcohol dehydrogenase
MRARWIEIWGGQLQRGERPDPRPAEGELLVQVQACGVGLTVLNCIRGDLGDDPANLPRVPGHEIVGTVAAVGPSVDPEWVGQRVMAFFYLFCGRCPECLAGREPLCWELAGYLGVDRDGGYAELVVLPARNVVCLPSGIDPVLATAIPDAIATPVHVARRCGLAPGERVAVIAAGGGVGIHMVQVARMYGSRVAGLEADQTKLARLETDFGVEAVDSSGFEGTRLPDGWKGKADVVVDLLGSPASLEWSLEVLDRKGRLALLTTFRGVTVPLSPRALVLAQGTVLGSRYASRHELMLAAEHVARGRVEPIVSETAGWSDVDRLHDLVRNGQLFGRGALVWKDGWS